MATDKAQDCEMGGDLRQKTVKITAPADSMHQVDEELDRMAERLPDDFLVESIGEEVR